MLPAGTTDLANRGPLPPGDAAASHPVAVGQGAGRSRGTPTGDQDDGHHDHRDDGSGDCDEDDVDDRADHDSILMHVPLWATRSAEWLASPSLHSLPPAPCGARRAQPAPVSVAAGHHYQGRLGQRIYGRPERQGCSGADDGGWQDDAAVASGVGFTDLVKRPTARASDCTARGRPRPPAGLMLLWPVFRGGEDGEANAAGAVVLP